MTRLPVVEPSTCAPVQREAIAEWMTDRGQFDPPGALWRMLVASPPSMRSIGKLGAFVRVGTSLDPLVQEVGALIASAERGFRFEVDIHETKVRALDVEPEQVYRVGSGKPSGLPEAAESVAVLAYAMARGERVDDAHVATLVGLLGEEHLVEVITVIAYFLMIGDLARVLEPDV
jgi:alkylhydroperoxidase family enzyme